MSNPIPSQEATAARFEEMTADELAGVVKQLMGQLASLQSERDRLRSALEKITRREGRYSMDHFTHAANTIEDMAKVASDALSSGESTTT